MPAIPKIISPMKKFFYFNLYNCIPIILFLADDILKNDLHPFYIDHNNNMLKDQEHYFQEKVLYDLKLV